MYMLGWCGRAPYLDPDTRVHVTYVYTHDTCVCHVCFAGDMRVCMWTQARFPRGSRHIDVIGDTDMGPDGEENGPYPYAY